ncbi:MAG: DUF1552 domain-containing protein [Planctomycetaceae bacterium]|nr:DUF1552 domain-containing protein [Planctomycetaceae bacterium]
MAGFRLPRRTFLKGVGATMALPLLEAMTPTRGWGAPLVASPNRMLFVFVPNGVIVPNWEVKGEGSDWTLSPTLEPLAKVKSKLCVLDGLMQDNARAKGDGPGDHARSAAAFLTGAHPVKTAGADIKNGVSVDQVAAEQTGKYTKLPSLEVGTEGGRNAGQCDSGYSCAYSNSISWKTATTPMSKEVNPRSVFRRLFGDREEAATRARRDAARQSVLDLVASDASKLQTKLGQTDRRKLEEYFTSVRELEQRIERAQTETAQRVIPDYPEPEGNPKDTDEHVRQMFDLLALAFQTDSTRVATYMLANEGSNRSYPMVGVNDGHHHLSHHQDKQDWIDQIAKIDKYLITRFAEFLEKLDATKDGEGTLLDHSMIVYGSAIADGNRHSHHDLPVLLAGKGNGTITPDRHIVYPHETPLNNLFLSLLERMDVQIDRLGDSTGKLDRLTT